MGMGAYQREEYTNHDKLDKKITIIDKTHTHINTYIHTQCIGKTVIKIGGTIIKKMFFFF